MSFSDYELYLSCLYQQTSKDRVFEMQTIVLRGLLKASFRLWVPAKKQSLSNFFLNDCVNKLTEIMH